MLRLVESIDGYLAQLASAAPVPGGGSAAMLVGAVGCSLVAMVARICSGGKRPDEVRERAQRLAERAQDLSERMTALRAQDEAAFAAVTAARGDDSAMQRALRAAAEAPLQGAHAARELLALAQEALELRARSLLSDVGCAAEFGHAALRACVYNVRINHLYMKDKEAIAAQRAQAEALQAQALHGLEAIRAEIAKRLADATPA